MSNQPGECLQATLTRKDVMIYGRALMVGECRPPYGGGKLSASIFRVKFSTPVRSIILMGAISLVGVLLVDFQQVVEIAGFGAFAVFVLVNCRVIVYYCIQRRERKEIQLITNLLLPLTGAGIFIAVWLSFFLDAHGARLIWLGLGIIFLSFMSKGFSRPVMD